MLIGRGKPILGEELVPALLLQPHIPHMDYLELNLSFYGEKLPVTQSVVWPCTKYVTCIRD